MDVYTRWDDFLIAEHEMIERGMVILKMNLENLDESVHRPLQMRRAIDFLLEFGDKLHNRKEEDYLFLLMEAKGVPVDSGPIGVMLMEHEAERKLLQQMAAQLDGLVRANDEERQQFKAKGLEYHRIRSEHIWKENDILYPMARQVLTAENAADLLINFNKLNTDTYGPEAWKQYRLMLDEVERGSAEKKLIQGLSFEQLDAIMEAMPFEVTFVDAEDTVAYFNRLDKPKLFPRTRSVVGRKVEKCHPERSVDNVRRIVQGFRDRTLDKAEFWINFRDEKVLIRYFPVYSDSGGKYLGVLEVTQAIGWIQQLEGEKRLLD